jgi:hypothetical protein
MRKVVLALVLVVAAAAGVLAQPAASGGPLAESSGWLCSVRDGNGGYAFTNDSYYIQYGGGHAFLTCSVEGAPNSSGKRFNWTYENSGDYCSWNGTRTLDWKVRVAANGDLLLTCHFAASTDTLRAASVSSGGLG